MRNRTPIASCVMLASFLLVSCKPKEGDTAGSEAQPAAGDPAPLSRAALKAGNYHVCDEGLHADHPTKFTGTHLTENQPLVIEALDDRVTRVKFGDVEHKMIRIGEGEELAMLVGLPHKESNAPADAPEVMVTHLVRIMNDTNYPGTKCHKGEKTILRIAFCVEEEVEGGGMKWLCGEDAEAGAGHLGDVHAED